MKTLAILPSLILAGTAVALDLTPRFGERELEAFNVPIVRFADGERAVSFRPPAAWKVSGLATELNLVPPDRPDAIVKLQVFPRKPVASDSGELDEDLKAWAKGLLPKDASDVVFISECESPFTLRTLSSHEFVFTFVQRGLKLTKSVAVVDLGEQQRFALSIATRPDDFEAIHREAISSMFSWQWEE